MPLVGGTFVSFTGFRGSIPLTATPHGTVTLPIAGLSGGVNVVLQSAFLDLSQPQQVAISNAVLAAFAP